MAYEACSTPPTLQNTGDEALKKRRPKMHRETQNVAKPYEIQALRPKSIHFDEKNTKIPKNGGTKQEANSKTL